MIFFCSHTRYTFPQTSVMRDANGRIAARRGMFVTCQRCGKRLPYDWQKMRILTDEEVNKGQSGSGKSVKVAA